MTIIKFLTRKLTSLFARVLFVILAFAVMIASVSVYVNSMLRNQLQREATEMLTQTGFKIKAEFIEPQTTLIAISDGIRQMLLRGDSFEEVLDTLRSLSRAMKTKPDGFTFYSIFGYFEIFDGVFFDTEGWAGDENYDPTDRPWYVTAVEAGDKLAITPLYYGFSSNAYIVTYVRRLFDEEGNPLGVLCMNMPTDRIKKYVDDMRITENSYGYLETEKFDIITHPNPDFIGKNVRDIHSSMLEVAEAVVMNSGVVYQGVSRNNAGFLMELYGMELDNGWILCFLTPVNEYYQRVTNMMLMLSIMGILMAGVLIFIFLSLERASKKVHEESRQKSVTLSEIEKKRETDERTQVMLNATPLSIDYWDKNFNIITCSEETVRLFGVKNKQEYVDKFFNFIPECQPDGSLSKEKVYGNLTKAYTKGYHRFEWVYKKSDGELIPSEVTLVRVQHKGEYNVLGFVKDLRKHKQMMNEIEQRDELLNMVNSTAVALLATKDEENLLPSIIEGMELLGKAVNADRVQIWKNEMIDNKLQFVHKCEWLSEFGRQKTPVPIGLHFPLSSKPEWEKKFYRNECINGPLRKLSQDSQDLLAPFGIKSIVNIPLFLQDKFWGFFSLDDCREERTFSADEIDILRSGGLLIASAFLRNEMTNNIRDTAARLEIALKEAQNANVAKSAFLANMSHEMRTPMNVILGITEILMRNEMLGVDTLDSLNKIYNSGDLLLGIINDILDLSKIDAGKLELAPSEYKITSLINDAVTLNMMRIGSKPIEFKISIDENIPSNLIGDELRIKQILTNLLSNSFKYTEKGTVKLSIDIAADKTAEDSCVTLVFKISDTGQGMNEEQVSRLFDEYSRFNIEVNRTTEGTGLGMSITRTLLQMMKGTIAVESEQGKGTTVIVCLPQKVTGSGVVGKELAENLQNFQTGGENQIKRSQMSFEPMPYGKVLVVDDVESNLFVAKGLLSPYRLQIETAFSGSEAIEKIKNLANQEPGGMYDIVFMDQMMPHMDGIETVKNIRTWENKQNLSNEYKHIPIVALTANAVVGQSDIFFANGFDGFISKPIDVRELNVILKKYVRDKQPPEVIEAAQQAEALKHNNGNGKTFAADTPNDSSHGTTSPLLAEIFVRDTRKAIVLLEDILHKHERFQHEKDKAGSDLQLFTVTVHGLKNALANVGETDLSALAAKLEQAGSDKDITVITEETPVLIEGLRRSIEKLAPEDSTDAETEMTEENRSGMKEKLLVIKKACDAFNQKAARRTLNELKERKWPSEIRELLGLMTENLLSGNMEETSNTADKIIEKIRG